MQINWVILVLFIIGCNLIGSIGTLWAGGKSSWYKKLKKPKFNPPSWVFGPAWTLLFSLMGVALYFIFFSPASRFRTVGLVLFGIQFVFNIAWSYLFFGLHKPFISSVEIRLLLILIILTSICFFLVYPLAGLLMVPYILWVSFASLLNYSIWRLNK